jgi:hypothetical protein
VTARAAYRRRECSHIEPRRHTPNHDQTDSRDRRRFELPHDRSEEADEFPRHRNDRDLWALPITQVIVSLMQALLRLPRVRDDRGRLPLLPSFDIDTRLRTVRSASAMT